MDKDTRNRIQHATQSARKLLEHEYAEQLDGVFDIRLDGTISAEPGEHLDARQRVLRAKLVTAVEHQAVASMSKTEAVAAYLQGAAFTTLNRFVALKMLEACELVQECISRGDQSAGFKEFTGLAAGLVQLPENGYRVYIESLFDELGREVRVLFDRRDPANLLWPRRRALLDLLGVLNDSELVSVWAEEETIGWVYQYFNTDTDRQKARYDDNGKPKTPKSSYELAVRNQFFTPRYVVRFLTDNTLGLIWYEMRHGQTRLSALEYLMRPLNEAFLADGEDPPRLVGSGNENRTQEELLQRVVHVPFRATKDPRDIRVLDPACGSGHFLLYAFQLLQVIYEEAWTDGALPASTATGRTLQDDYPSIETLRAALPGLILRHNLYGIDIDIRCAQIAALALWIRAQRAYKEMGIARDARAPIQKTNIVVAEPMPGNPELRREFFATLEPDVAELVLSVFDGMQLAGEAGTLLRIDEDIREAVREIHPATPGELLRPLDKDRWERAEEKMLRALRAYSDHSLNGGAFQRRLFADDAVRGLGFVDVCSQRYDLVLMNPPFGDGTAPVLDLLARLWPNAKRNLYIGFVYRAFELLSHQGLVGAITDATFVHQTRYEDYRRDLLDAERIGLRTLVTNGWGVLDAYVETACLVAGRPAPAELVTIDARESEDRQDLVQTSVEGVKKTTPTNATRVVNRAVFSALPKSALAFWLPGAILDQYRYQPTLDPALVDARCGMSSSDNPRFYKVWWEVSASDIGDSKRWRFLANGGPPSPLFRQQVYVVNWGQDGRETKSRVEALYGSASRTIINEPHYFRPGLTFGKRTESFTGQFLPAGGVFSNEGQAIFPRNLSASDAILGYLNTSMIAYVLNSIAGQHKEAGYVGSIPGPPSSYLNAPKTSARMQQAHRLLLDAAACVPESQVFRSPLSVDEGPSRTISGVCEWLMTASDELERTFQENDRAIEASVGFEPAAQTPWDTRSWRIGKCVFECDDASLPRVVAADYVGYLLGLAFGRWCQPQDAPASAALAEPLRELAPRCPALSSSNEELTVGILVDDHGHNQHVVTAIEAAHRSLVASKVVAQNELQNARRLLVDSEIDLRELVRTALFHTHLERYSKSRRKAPIYWQLATPSASYSVWLYYHGLSRDTVYTLLNDYVDPKLKYEERKLNNATQEMDRSPSASWRKEIDAIERFVGELRAFREELSLVAPIWNPDLNDGVIINFAPLWRLVAHQRAWQKDCKATWDKLVAGGQDWARLAMHLWPERVIPKCAKDRSLAIAHGLEGVFWYEDRGGKWQPRNVDQAEVEMLVTGRTSAAVKDALKALLEAPAPVTGRSSKTKALRAKGTRKRTALTRRKAATNGASFGNRLSEVVDLKLLSKVKDALAANGDGASRADVIDATGITSSQWNTAIKALLADGSVTQTGERRGTRYHLAGGDA